MAADFQAIVDGMAAMTCVVSVEPKPDGGYGDIRIVTGNRAYIDSIENPSTGAEMLTRKFTPNSEYTRYLTRDLNFEDFCYRSAVLGKCLHSYVHPDRMDVWLNMTFMPLESDDAHLRYCTYTMEINHAASSERMSNVSGDLAAKALEIAITLRSSDDFRQAMATAVHDIRRFCKAEYCCILLVDEHNRSCSVLAEDATEGSPLLPMDSYLDDAFYGLVESWPAAIAGSNCLIAKNAHDMDVVKERNPRWHASLTNASVNSIVLFPLKSHGNLLGYIWAINFEADESARIKEALELTTYVLAAEIDNHLLLQRLKVLSSRDMLTGVLNRNEMNNRLEALSLGRECPGMPVGIVFADLNGLKPVNDTQGHAAGDKLLKEGVSILAGAFDTASIYRAGGDEFVVIQPGATEDALRGKVQAIRDACSRSGRVSFALGHCVEGDCRKVREALHMADERMYADKQAHYGGTYRGHGRQ